MRIFGATSLGPLDFALIEILIALRRGFAYAFGFMAATTPMGIINISLLPIFIFPGSFYPIPGFPDWAQIIIKTLPLWHAIEMIRCLSLGLINFSLLGHATYSLSMITLGVLLTTKRPGKIFIK